MQIIADAVAMELKVTLEPKSWQQLTLTPSCRSDLRQSRAVDYLL